MNNWAIHLGEGEEFEGIEAYSVALILTDPPFGTTQCPWDKPPRLDRFFSRGWDVLKENGLLGIWSMHPFSFLLHSKSSKDHRYTWILEKKKPSANLGAKLRPLNVVDELLIFYKRQPHYSPLFMPGTPYKGTPRKSSSKTQHYGKYGEHRNDNDGVRYPRSIITIPQCFKRKDEKHDSEKSVESALYFILTYTQPGDLVVDNFSGSCAIGEAALLSGRRYRGFETNPEWVQRGQARLENIQRILDTLARGDKEKVCKVTKFDKVTGWGKVQLLGFLLPFHVGQITDRPLRAPKPGEMLCATLGDGGALKRFSFSSKNSPKHEESSIFDLFSTPG